MAKASTQKTTGTSAFGNMSIGKHLTLGALIAELLGSAVLAFAALMSGNNPIIAAVAVIVLTLVFFEVSGAVINPVAAVAGAVLKQFSWVKALGFIVVQVLGAMLAYVIVAKFMAGDNGASGVYTLFTNPSDAASSLSPRAPGEWKPVFGEFVGAIVFSFGLASAMLYKKVGFDRAFTIGGALMIGLIGALAGSYGVLNPAVAAGLSGYAQGGFWSFAAYGLAPLAGAVVGAGLFKLIKQDVDAADKK